MLEQHFAATRNMLNIIVIFTSAMAKVMFSSLPVTCLFVCLSACLSVCLSVCMSVCLSVINITEKRLNGFSWNFQGRWDLIQGTIGNIFRMFHFGDDRCNPLDTGFPFPFPGSVFIGVIPDGWTFMKFSGYGHKKQQATLFHAWVDSFTLFKLGVAEVCALGVLLICYGFVD